VRSTVLIRSGHLGNVTSAGCTALTDTLSVRSVVDLRDASDVSATPDAACVLTNTRYLHAELPKILPPTPSSYLETLAAADDRLDGIYAHLTAQGALPALVHCVIGRDRAGIVMALLLLSLGVPRDAVLRDFTDNQEATVDAAWLAAVIDEVESAGGIEAYLASRGVTAQEIAAFQALALE
jgi:protein-tyrosine phosphatase